jgi:putative DNA primase/helicase
VTQQSERELGTHELDNPNQPLKVARTLATRYPGDLAWWRGSYYTWTGRHWTPEQDDLVIQWLYQATETATYVGKDSKGEDKVVPWAPTRKKIADLEHALSRGALQRTGEDVRGLILANGVVETDPDGQRVLLPHSPLRFNLTSLPFDYVPDAVPAEWLAFLDSSLPGDTTAHDFLQEWFGYVLSGRTDHQMMASLVGASRSGKGVIVRVLEAMLGPGHTTGVTLNDLAGEYGLSGLIGKSLATISEPKWASRAAGEVVEPLLRITGNDQVRANRKYQTEWVGHLGVRFMILSNETPRLINRSGALANRMTHIRFSVSFAGREDITLEDRLMAELPGILNWALDGLDRLEKQGRFTRPESHGQVDARFREYADPDAEFLEQMCTVGEDLKVSQQELFEAYRRWCEDMGRTKDATDVTTLRHRLAERPGISDKRIGQAKVWHLTGIGLSETALAKVKPFGDWAYSA